MQQLSYLGFGILGLTSTIHGMALPFLIEEFALTLSAAGLLLFANSFGYLVASVAFPFLQNRRTSGWLLSLAFLIVTATYGLFPLSPWWIFMIILGFVASLGTGTIDVGFNTLISSLEPKIAQPALNWLHFSYGIGALIGPAFLSRLLKLGFSWRSFYISSSLLALLFVALWRGNLKNTPQEKPTTNSWGNARALYKQVVKRLAPKPLLILLTSSTSVAMLILVFSKPLWLVFAILLLVGLFLSAIFPLIMLQSAFLFPQFVAESTSSLVIAGSFGAMVGPAFLGLIGQYISLQAGVAVLAGFMLMSTLIIAAVPQEPVHF